jgi:hypothetical protein
MTDKAQFDEQLLLFVKYAFGHSFDGINGEIRTNDFTIVTVDAVVRLFHLRGMIPLDIVLRGELEDFARAEGDAIAAALAPLGNNVHDSSRYFDPTRIQRNSPISHRVASLSKFQSALSLQTPKMPLSASTGGYFMVLLRQVKHKCELLWRKWIFFGGGMAHELM